MKKIIHFDLDYFFAQVELLDKPELHDQPVAIGGTSMRRGVLSTCNYVARRYGLHSAMPTFKALELCPRLILLKSNFNKYSEYSKKVFDIFYEFTDQVQVVSVDEAYLDVTDCSAFNNCATDIAKEIKRRVYETTGLTGSAGVSYNKLLAKIASEYNKPDGLFVITPKVFEQIGDRISVTKINGVGKVTAERMKELKINTFGDLKRYSKLDLINLFGRFGVNLYDYCRGHDRRIVSTERERKSLSVERTFSQNMLDSNSMLGELKVCFNEFSTRMDKYDEVQIKSCFVKIKYADFTQTTIEYGCRAFSEKIFSDLFLKRFSERKEPVRLLGVGVRFNCDKGGESQLRLI